ncbi:MAG: LytR C-terminal domain-containing protein [Bacteroidota bacterium]|nr:LytR C-terminal domain-containing protein [Bacteroidota bacterium]
MKLKPNDKKNWSKLFLTWTLNVIIFLLFIIVAYLFYAFLSQQIPTTGNNQPTLIDTSRQIIQVEILNGSGGKGIAAKFTNYLRTKGIDVVDTRNYRSSDIEETIVIDRIGNLQNASQVANALGVSDTKIIQQINTDYFIAVTVVIGKDYPKLKPMM